MFLKNRMKSPLVDYSSLVKTAEAFIVGIPRKSIIMLAERIHDIEEQIQKNEEQIHDAG